MLQRITSLIVIGAALFQVNGFAALRRYFVDLEIFAPSTLANIGAVADWGYQVILASPNIVAIALLFVARIALTDSVIRPYTTQPLELVFISDGPANYRDAAATWYSRFAWVRFWIRSIPPAYVVVIALSLAALTISAESYADKTASQVLATGSRAQITPSATVVEYAEVRLRAPATLSPAISKANNSKNLAILWSDESIVAIGLKGKLNASSPLEGENRVAKILLANDSR